MTPDQIITCLSQDGSREDMLKAAFRMGMLRAWEVVDMQGVDKVTHALQRAIRAEANAAKPERKFGELSALDQRLE